MTTAGLACGTCGTELHENARFCHTCGSPVTQAHKVAEYKQVTVRSMEIAAAVGPERLRELMTELVNRSAAVVRRYGGTLNQFTGDGSRQLPLPR